MTTAEDIVQFWFGNAPGERRKVWFVKDPAFDAEISARFLATYEKAASGGLSEWENTARDSLALIILTDQFPRNMFRGQGKAFATDPHARAAARRALEAGWDLAVPEPERQFMYLPFEHSEDPEDQSLSVRLFTERLPSEPDNIHHARAHAEVIRRYSRFPTRNAALGRDNTLAEQVYLDEGGYAAIVTALRA